MRRGAAHNPCADTDLCLVSLGWSVADLTAGYGRQAAGGAEVQVSRIARMLTEAGFRISLLAPHSPREEELSRSLADQGIRLITSYRDGGIPYLRYFYSTVPGFWGGLKRASAKVYYLRGSSGFVGMAAAFCRRFGRRLVFAVSSDGDVDPALLRRRFNRRDYALYTWGLRQADAVVAQTRTQQELLKRHWGMDALLIRSIYPSSPRTDPGSPDYVLWAGRARRLKRPGMFLELARRLPHLRFTMIGRGMSGEGDLYRGLAEQAKSIPNLLFAGAVPFSEMPAWYQRAWVFVNTSETEGFPNTFLEAWDHELPVIATVDPDGLLSERGMGYYCPDLGRIVEHIELLHRSPALRAEIGARARAYLVQEHRPERIIAQYVHLVTALMEGEAIDSRDPSSNAASVTSTARGEAGDSRDR